MFRFRVRTDAIPRTKKGQPAHKMTGVARASSTQLRVVASRLAHRWPNMARAKTMIVAGKDTQKRRVKSASSGVSSSSSEGIIGSSAMPHLGQVPGPSWTISGCIGQV